MSIREILNQKRSKIRTASRWLSREEQRLEDQREYNKAGFRCFLIIMGVYIPFSLLLILIKRFL